MDKKTSVIRRLAKEFILAPAQLPGIHYYLFSTLHHNFSNHIANVDHQHLANPNSNRSLDDHAPHHHSFYHHLSRHLVCIHGPGTCRLFLHLLVHEQEMLSGLLPGWRLRHGQFGIAFNHDYHSPRFGSVHRTGGWLSHRMDANGRRQPGWWCLRHRQFVITVNHDYHSPRFGSVHRTGGWLSQRTEASGWRRHYSHVQLCVQFPRMV